TICYRDCSSDVCSSDLEHRLGALRSDDHELVGSLNWIFDVPERNLDRLVINLVVADARLEVNVPVDQPFALVNQAILEQLEKCLADGAGEAFVEGKSCAGEIGGRAEALELLDDAIAVLLFPLPDAGDEGFAAQIVTGFVFFFLELLFDDGLCRDAGMID